MNGNEATCISSLQNSHVQYLINIPIRCNCVNKLKKLSSPTLNEVQMGGGRSNIWMAAKHIDGQNTNGENTNIVSRAAAFPTDNKYEKLLGSRRRKIYELFTNSSIYLSGEILNALTMTGMQAPLPLPPPISMKINGNQFFFPFFPFSFYCAKFTNHLIKKEKRAQSCKPRMRSVCQSMHNSHTSCHVRFSMSSVISLTSISLSCPFSPLDPSTKDISRIVWNDAKQQASRAHTKRSHFIQSFTYDCAFNVLNLQLMFAFVSMLLLLLEQQQQQQQSSIVNQTLGCCCWCWCQ